MIREWEARDVGAGDRQAELAPRGCRERLELDPDRAAMARQHRKVLPDPAPAVDDAEIGAAAGNLGKHRADETPEAVEPEVRVGGAPRLAKPLVHQRRRDRVVPDGGAGAAGFAVGCFAAGRCRAGASAARPALTSRIP